MNPAEFIAKWSRADLSDRSAAQQHFLDLCELFEHPKPAEVDPQGDWFTFEKGAGKHGGGDGWGTVRYSRLVSKDDECAEQLKRRTLTSLYNQRPAWLDLAHRKLDEAVFAAYGWAPDLSDEQILENLLALNLERAAEESAARGPLRS